jgi:periplasmic protein TonB
MYLQNPIFNRININQTILLSIMIHAVLLFNLQWDSVKLISEPEIEINIQERKIKREIPIPKPIEKPKLIEKPKPIEDIVPIKEIIPPLSEPEVKQVKKLTTSKDIVEKKPTNIKPQIINNYSNKIRAHIERFKKYPRMAQMRGWKGEVLIEAEIDGNGLLISSVVIRSSGRKILDNEGLAMMDRSAPFPTPPEGRNLKMTIPISFSMI